MFIFIHLIAGLLIGLTFDSKVIIVALALVSHLLLDYIPHWDGWFKNKEFVKNGIAYLTNKDFYIICMDFILTIISIILFYHYTKISGLVYIKSNVVLAAFVSLLPDLLKAGYLTELRYTKGYDKFIKFHSKIQEGGDDIDWKIGIIVQALFVIAFIISLIYIMFY